MNIRRPILTLLVMALCTGAALAQTAAYTSKPGRFSIVWPAATAPAPTTQTTDSPLGKLQYTSFALDLGSKAAMMSYSDYPAKAIAKQDKKKMLENARDGALRAIGGQVSAQTEGTQQGAPDINFTFSSKAVYGRAHLILSGARLYQIIYYSKSKADLTKPEVGAFFKSFQIVK